MGDLTHDDFQKTIRLCDGLIEVVNESKVSTKVALNALMRVASLIDVQAGGDVEDFVAGARSTYETVASRSAS